MRSFSRTWSTTRCWILMRLDFAVERFECLIDHGADGRNGWYFGTRDSGLTLLKRASC